MREFERLEGNSVHAPTGVGCQEGRWVRGASSRAAGGLVAEEVGPLAPINEPGLPPSQFYKS